MSMSKVSHTSKYVVCDSNAFNKVASVNDIKTVKLNIKASHSGKINGNYAFYTPRAMEKGAYTLSAYKYKPLQDGHFNFTIGNILDADYQDYTSDYPDDIKKKIERVNNANSGKDLVLAVKDIVSSDFYKSKNYKGMGVLNVKASLWDSKIITDLYNGSNKGKVSIGGSTDQKYCSICYELMEENHEHLLGVEYGGETCFCVCDELTLDHVGFVQIPADSATHTTIVSDALNDNNVLSMSIESVEENKNNKGHIMTIDQLKELAKSLDNFVNVDGLTDDQKTKLKEAVTASTKYARGASFLISEDKLLPVVSKESVALTAKAIEQLADGSDKDLFTQQLQTYLETYFKDEDLDAYLKSYGIEQPAVEPEQPENPENTDPAEPEQPGVDNTDKTPLALSQQDVDNIANALASKLSEKQQVITDNQKPNHSLDILLSNNKQLVTDYQAIDEVNQQLKKTLKQQLIKNILIIKNTKDADYTKMLESYSIEALEALLADAEFSVQGNQQTQEPEQVVSQPEQPVAEPEQPQAQTVQDSQQPELQKVGVEDNLTNLQTPEKSVVTDNLNTQEDVYKVLKEKGFAEYLKAIKNK